jgi:hypothetical protein
MQTEGGRLVNTARSGFRQARLGIRLFCMEALLDKGTAAMERETLQPAQDAGPRVLVVDDSSEDLTSLRAGIIGISGCQCRDGRQRVRGPYTKSALSRLVFLLRAS